MKVIKMRPSHIPVINAMIKTFAPKSVIECGCGPNSTPIWSKVCDRVVGIEHNQEWVDQIKPTLGDNVEFITHDFYGITFGMYPDTLKYARRKEVYDWYNSLYPTGQLSGDCDLLFVDSYAGYRVYALMALAQQAGIVMYHDTEVPRYWYSSFEKKLEQYYPNGFKHYSYRPRVHREHGRGGADDEGFREIARQEPCTDIIFRPEHFDKIEQFEIALDDEHRKYYWQNAPFEFVEIK